MEPRKPPPPGERPPDWKPSVAEELYMFEEMEKDLTRYVRFFQKQLDITRRRIEEIRRSK